MSSLLTFDYSFSKSIYGLPKPPRWLQHAWGTVIKGYGLAPLLVLVVLFPRRFDLALLVWTLALLFGMANEYGLKQIFRRPRPDYVGENVVGSSFPSTHALALSFATVCTVGLQLFPLLWVCIFAAYATFTIFTRIWTGAHFVTDVLAGCLVGGMIGVIVILMLGNAGL